MFSTFKTRFLVWNTQGNITSKAALQIRRSHFLFCAIEPKITCSQENSPRTFQTSSFLQFALNNTKEGSKFLSGTLDLKLSYKKYVEPPRIIAQAFKQRNRSCNHDSDDPNGIHREQGTIPQKKRFSRVHPAISPLFQNCPEISGND